MYVVLQQRRPRNARLLLNRVGGDDVWRPDPDGRGGGGLGKKSSPLHPFSKTTEEDKIYNVAYTRTWTGLREGGKPTPDGPFVHKLVVVLYVV